MLRRRITKLPNLVGRKLTNDIVNVKDDKGTIETVVIDIGNEGLRVQPLGKRIEFYNTNPFRYYKTSSPLFRTPILLSFVFFL